MTFFSRSARAAALLTCMVSLSFAQEKSPPTPPHVATPEEAATVGSPEWIIATFFKQKDFPDRPHYFTREMRIKFGAQPNPGAGYADPSYVLEQHRFYETDSEMAIAATIVHESVRHEYYVFFRKENDGWKVEAARLNGPSPSIMQAMGMMGRLRFKPGSPDAWEAQTLSAFTINDEQHKVRFKAKHEALDRLVKDLVHSGYNQVVHGARKTGTVSKEIWQQVRDLNFYYVEVDDRGRIEFNLARAGESAVGYYWIPDSSTAPSPGPDSFVLMEPLGSGWYLYRKI